ncbi:sensor histidine kinase YesM [Paenibacillus baekrokdamisoli]|nr:histidine kinase [Paenibacillus baekrokdamisoli]MBB3067665.1 sensor histidine kinase YesM [Paenibacillus baekrokdamisoli]
MMVIYSLLTLIPLTLVSGTFYLRSKHILEQKLMESRNQTLMETAGKIDGILRAFAKKTNDIGDQPQIVKLLRNTVMPTKYPLESNEKQRIITTVQNVLDSEMDNMKLEIGDYADAIYLHEGTNLIYSTGSQIPIQFLEGLHVMTFEREGQAEWAFFIDHQRLVCNLQILDRENGMTLGYLTLMLNPQKVQQLYDNYSPNTFLITSKNNIILSMNTLTQIGQLFEKPKDRNIVVDSTSSKYADFKYLSIIRTNELSSEMVNQTLFAAAITLLSWISVLFITYFILKNVTNPLRTLTKLMKRAERGEYALISNIRSQDEIATLCHSFNRLILETQDLIQKVYKTELLHKEAELKAIRMYMNPHFLYNSLEYISSLARTRTNIEHIPDIMQKIAAIFRFSISPGHPLIPLHTELEFLQNYIQIHQYSYGERFRYELQTDPHLMNVKVPKLILQPLVENAFIHGIDANKEQGVLIIRAYEENYEMIIEVEDNGGGINDSALNSKGLGTGLAMIQSRIQHHFGDKYGLEFMPVRHGTLVRLKLPILM